MYDCISKACDKSILHFLNISECLLSVFVTSSEYIVLLTEPSIGLGYCTANNNPYILNFGT